MIYLIRALLLITAALSLVACDATATTPTATPEPTATEPSPAVIPVPDVELPQQFTANDLLGGTITVNFPDDWFQGGTADGVTLSNNADFVGTSGIESVESGVVVVLLSAVPRASAGLLVVEDQPISAETLLNAFLPSEDSPDDALELNLPQNAQIADLPLAFVEGNNATDALLTLVLEQPDFFVLLSAVTAADELDDFRETIHAIALNIDYALLVDGQAESTSDPAASPDTPAPETTAEQTASPEAEATLEVTESATEPAPTAATTAETTP